MLVAVLGFEESLLECLGGVRRLRVANCFKVCAVTGLSNDMIPSSAFLLSFSPLFPRNNIQAVVPRPHPQGEYSRVPSSTVVLPILRSQAKRNPLTRSVTPPPPAALAHVAPPQELHVHSRPREERQVQAQRRRCHREGESLIVRPLLRDAS